MADVISSLVPPALSDGGSPPGPVQIKYKDMGDGSYAPVVAVDASSIVAAVTTDGETILGDGTVGDPLTTDGGIGAPYWIPFSLRDGSVAGATNYFAIALNGSIGSGGFTLQDPTDIADAGGWAVSYALQLSKGELSNFRVGLANGAGLGETLDFSIRINAADPVNGLAVQFTGDSAVPVFANDTTHTVDVPQDSYVAIKLVASGAASYNGATGRVLFTPKP